MRICPQECVNVASHQKRWRVREATETMRIRSEDTKRHVITGSEGETLRSALLLLLVAATTHDNHERVYSNEWINLHAMDALFGQIKCRRRRGQWEWVSGWESENVAQSKVSLCKFNFTRPFILSSVTCTCVTCYTLTLSLSHTAASASSSTCACSAREKNRRSLAAERCTNVQMVHWLRCLARFTIEW